MYSVDNQLKIEDFIFPYGEFQNFSPFGASSMVEFRKSNIIDDGVQEISYEFVRDILSSFSNMLSELPSREQQKKLLHMLISKITINKTRDIESI